MKSNFFGLKTSSSQIVRCCTIELHSIICHQISNLNIYFFLDGSLQIVHICSLLLVYKVLHKIRVAFCSSSSPFHAIFEFVDKHIRAINLKRERTPVCLSVLDDLDMKSRFTTTRTSAAACVCVWDRNKSRRV